MVLPAAAVCRATEVFPVVHNEPLSVRVLDGRSGRPQAAVHVALVAGYTQRDLALEMWREEAMTDAAGMAQVSNALRNLPLLRVEVLHLHGCAPAAETMVLSVERIRGGGLSAANRCGAVVAENAPGVMTVFVKGKRDATPSVLAAGLPGSVATPPIPATVSVTGAAPQPGTTASHASYPTVSADNDSDETSVSEPEAPAATTQPRERVKAAAHAPANASGDELAGTSRPDPAMESAIPSLGLDIPPAGGSAPRTGQRNVRPSAALTPAKQTVKPARVPAPDAKQTSKPSAKPPVDAKPATGAATAVPVLKDKPAASAKAAPGHSDQSGGSSKTSPSTAAHAAPASVAPAPPGHGAATIPVPGVVHELTVSPKPAKDPAATKPAKALPQPSADPAQATARARTIPPKPAPSAHLARVSTSSAVQAHEIALAAVQAASAAASAPAPRMTRLSHRSGPPSSSVQVPVRAAAPAQKPAKPPAEAPYEVDVDPMCEPG
jgi:hypothetical protein